MSCACGNSPSIAKCCGPFIQGEALPPTAEALMRARYTAYTLKEVDYVLNTCDPDAPGEADRDATKTWAEKSQWLGLEVVSTEAGGPDDDEGQVEFIARYRFKGDEQAHHERARFRRVDGRWYYIDGQFVKPKTKKRDAPKIGRNDPCSCGSGEKYKKCCGAA